MGPDTEMNEIIAMLTKPVPLWLAFAMFLMGMFIVAIVETIMFGPPR